MTDKNSWLADGANVFIVEHDRVTVAKIAKVTDRDVVIESGSRFSRKSLHAYGRGAFQNAQLAPLDDQGLIARYRAQRASAAARRVGMAADEFLKSPNPTTADGIAAALDAWRALDAKLKP